MSRKDLLIPYDAPLVIDIEPWYRLAVFATARFHRMDMEDDRIHDWAMDSLIRCGQTFDETKGLQFKSFLIGRCNWDGMRRLNKRALERIRVGKYVDLAKARHKEYEEPLDIKDAIDTHLRYLSKRDKRILLLRSQGVKLHEVGEDVGLSRERVRQVQIEACERVKKRRQQ